MVIKEVHMDDSQNHEEPQSEETREQKKKRLLDLIKHIEKFETEQQLQILSDFLCLVLEDLSS